MANCRSCGARIVFVEAAAPGGRRMPLDHEPDESGNVLWNQTDGVYLVLRGGQVEPGTWEGKTVSRHKSHFVTCPSADQHRKRGRNRESTTH